MVRSFLNVNFKHAREEFYPVLLKPQSIKLLPLTHAANCTMWSARDSTYQLAWKVKYTFIIRYVLITIVFGKKCKNLQRKGKVSQVYCLGVVVTIRVNENDPPMKILHEKDLMAIQECPHEV